MNELELYVHIPFCVRKCAYCDFLSFPSSEDLRQTYVDALKKTGTFDFEAQKQAATKALNACLAAISPTAKAFIEEMYGDVTAYLSTKIEAEVRTQKTAPVAVEAVTLESSADTTTIAASTAAATAATIAQTAIAQIGAEPAVQEQ